MLVRNRQKKLLIVPNLPLLKSTKEIPELLKNNYSNKVLGILRIGRPDMKKWTALEVDIFVKLFGTQTSEFPKLTLVGAPEPIVEHANSVGMGIECIPYKRSIEGFYKINDVYFLYSRIGETFGNTIFEAALYGMNVIFVFNLKWDCGPIEYLLEFKAESHIFEVSNISQISNSMFQRKNVQNFRKMNDMFLQKNSELILRRYEKLEVERPSFFASVNYIFKLGSKFKVKFSKVLYTVVIEILRESYLLQTIRRIS
jgi:hypothetical protein